MTYDVELRARKRTRQAIMMGAIVLLAIVAVIAIVVAASGGGHGSHERSARPPATAPPNGTGISSADLNALTWREFQGVDLPYSSTNGPTQRSKDLASAFAHTQLGAVLAAAHISARTSSVVGSDVFRPTIKNQMTGPHVASFLAGNEQDYEESRKEGRVSPGKPLHNGSGKLLGFRIEHYDSSYAAIHLLTAGPTAQGGYTQYDFRVEVKWVDGDWKALVPVDEEWDSAIKTNPDEGSFTRFPGRE